MKKSILKKLNLLLIYFFLVNGAWPEISLSNLNTNWTKVLPGSVITEPLVTSYGFCLVTDARLLSAFSNEGRQIWERPVKRSRKVILSNLPSDFILYIDNQNKDLRLLNPSGLEIWSKKITEPITQKPLAGRDGRFFFQTSNFVQCFGMNGGCKWKLKVENQKNLPLQELPDGSIVAFLTEEDSKTRGLRISPFGQVLENITFAGHITNVFGIQKGILLTFEDGKSGLFTIAENESVNKWVIPLSCPVPFFVTDNEKNNFYHLELNENSVKVNQIDFESGNVTTSFIVDDISGKNLTKLSLDKSGLFLSDQNRAYLVNREGKKYWNANFESKEKSQWNYIIYTNYDYLVFCYKNWTLNAWKIASNKYAPPLKAFNSDYSDFYTITDGDFNVKYSDSFDSNSTSVERTEKLKKGFYASDETKISSQVVSICKSYINKLNSANFSGRRQLSIFDTDTSGFENILNQLTLLGNSNTQEYIGKIIEKSSSDYKNYLMVILNNIYDYAYDPDKKILSALEILSKKIDSKDSMTIEKICDSVFAICKFNGRPAYNSKAKDILKNFMFPNYDLKIRTYASNTLKKIKDLEL